MSSSPPPPAPPPALNRQRSSFLPHSASPSLALPPHLSRTNTSFSSSSRPRSSSSSYSPSILSAPSVTTSSSVSLNLDPPDDGGKRRGSEGSRSTGRSSSIVPSLADDSAAVRDDGSLSSGATEPGEATARGEIVPGEGGEDDPRVLLRAQLRRSLSTTHPTPSSPKVSKVGADLKGKGRAAPEGGDGIVELEAGAESEEAEAIVSRLYQPRKYFILTDAGKPVFSMNTSETDLNEIVGVLQALISIFLQDDGDKLRSITRGPVKIVILLRPPLYFCCVSDWGEPESILRTHLEYLHLHILSIITSVQLKKIFVRQKNFDLRRLLEGTDNSFQTLITSLQSSFPLLTHSLSPLRSPPSLRESLGQALLLSSHHSSSSSSSNGTHKSTTSSALSFLNPTSSSTSSSHNPLSSSSRAPSTLLYSLLIASPTPSQPNSPLHILTLLRPRRHSIHPTDLALLLNLIRSSPSLLLPGNESWLPICLPKFREDGFLHVYVTFVREGVGLVWVGSDKGGFEGMREGKERVMERLESANLLPAIERAIQMHPYSVGDLNIPGLLHFIYRSTVSVQVTQPTWDAPYDEPNEQNRLFTQYQRCYDALHGRSHPGADPLSLIYIRTEKEAVIGWFTQPFELYLALPSSLPKAACVSVANKVARWVRREEGNLFLKDAPVF